MLRWFTTGSNVRPPPRKETYAPPLVRGEAPVEEVPDRLRGLRLRRRRVARMPRTPLAVRIAIVLAILGFLAGIVLVATAGA